MRILLLEDDAAQRESSTSWLEGAGHVVHACATGADAITAVERDSFDLAVLGWETPYVSGEEVLRWIRKRNQSLPVLFATARDGEDAIVHILGLGADDYLVKPLRQGEFLARVAALGRRARVPAGEAVVIDVGAYRADLLKHHFHIHGQRVQMTPRMGQVAALLFRKRGQVVSRREIYEEVWGHRVPMESRSVDTHVSRIRKVLQLDGANGLRLISVYQHGYRLEEA